MALQVDVTLRRLVWELNQWASDHKQVNDFGYGKYLEVFRSDADGRNYPALIVNAPNATSDKWYINFSLEIICLEYVLDEKDNKDRANSDTNQIIRDLENTMRYSNRWQKFCRIDANFNYQKIDEFGADKCFGWLATIEVKIKRRHGICNIKAIMPEYDFETGLTVIPTCDPVVVTINDATWETYQSGTTNDIPVKDTNGAEVGSKVGSEWIVPAAGGDPVTSNFNGVATGVDTPAGSLLNIAAVNSVPATVGSLVVNTSTVKSIAVYDSNVSNSDDSYGVDVPAETDLELSDRTIDVKLDGVTIETVTYPAMTEPDITIVWQ